MTAGPAGGRPPAAALAATAAALGRPVVAVGVDLVEVARIERALARTAGFADRVFTPAEQERARGGTGAERYALRWAVKEAVFKALGVGIGGAALTEVELGRRDGGEPYLVLHGRAAALAASRGIGDWLVSATHTEALAEAVVLGLAARP